MQYKIELDINMKHPVLYCCWRKVIDITFSLGGLLLIFLLLPILAVSFYLDSPGPIFYCQERIGYQGKKFQIFKFRSMHINSEEVGCAVWASKGDVRVTRVGQFLRATHLDELPQVLNILRGEMSLIGPRPEREEYALELEKINLCYRHRLIVKPGLTGWAQVNCRYGSTMQEELVKLQFDIFYIEHPSFTFDIWILLKTVVEVICYRGT